MLIAKKNIYHFAHDQPAAFHSMSSLHGKHYKDACLELSVQR